jgi:hypothetical protein
MMEVENRQRPRRDWRDPVSYADTRSWSRGGWAWEFLDHRPAYPRTGHVSSAMGTQSRQCAHGIEPLGSAAVVPAGRGIDFSGSGRPTHQHCRMSELSRLAPKFWGRLVGKRCRLTQAFRCETVERERWRLSPGCEHGSRGV